MKTKLILSLMLMVGMVSLTSVSAGAPIKSSRVEQNSMKSPQKRTIIEFGDYYYNGDWFYVYGDPATGEITHIIPFGLVPGSEVASWTGNCIYHHGAWHGNFTVTPVVGSSYFVGAELVFA